MEKKFELMYQALEKKLQEIAKKSTGIDLSRQSIDLVRKVTLEIKDHIGETFNTEDEIQFFRHVWPPFYGKLFFYIKIHRFEMCRQYLPQAQHSNLIKNEEQKIVQFFHDHSHFALNYQSGSASIDHLFTRKYSINSDYEDLSLVIDSGKSTLASYNAARCLANWAYKEFLERELANTQYLGKNPREDIMPSDRDYTWDLTDADFVEWLYGLHAVKAIKFRGELADISRLQKWAKWALSKEVVNIYDRFKVLRNRKKERIPFTKQTANSLERRMDESEGKYE